MITPNLALYRLLVKFGATEADAETAATFDAAALATKQDLAEWRAATKQDLAELEARLAWKIGALVVGALVSLTGIFAALVKLL